MHDAAEWKRLAGQFLHDGIVRRNADGYGELVITDAGLQVLAGQRTVIVARRQVEQAAPRSRTTEIADRDLFDALRQWRKQTAEEEGVPPYIIFSDKTLQSLAERKPSSPDALMSIPGIGTVKLQRYGRAVLEITGRAAAGEDRRVLQQNSAATGSRYSDTIPTHLESTRLFNAGHDIAHIARVRNINPRTVLAHLTRAVQEGITVDRNALERLLPPDAEIRQKIITAFERFGTDRLAPVYDTLGGCVDYDILSYVRLFVLSGGNLCKE
jgi:ATP-dependent DNA helicase RecQ